MLFAIGNVAVLPTNPGFGTTRLGENADRLKRNLLNSVHTISNVTERNTFPS